MVGFIVFFVVMTFVVLPMVIKYENNLEKIKFKPAISNLENADTLRISCDLGNEKNVDKYIKNKFPDYKILEYEIITSDYSLSDGQHTFYSFILIKK